jgi:hypothetical protein
MTATHLPQAGGGYDTVNAGCDRPAHQSVRGGHTLRQLGCWWHSGLTPWVKLVYLLLLANGLPACIILLGVPSRTQDLFVWTIAPPASARLLGVMYTNALVLIAFGIAQPDWPRTRVVVLLVAYFSIAATRHPVESGPFLQHPWYHLAY